MTEQLQRNARDPLNGLIIISGHARSGTSWLGKIFDSHPLTVYRHEPEAVHPDLLSMIGSTETRECITRLVTTRRVRTAKAFPFFAKNYRRAIWEPVWRSLVVGGNALGRPGRLLPIPDFIQPDQRANVRHVWKSIRTVPVFESLAENLPEARVIHLMRHPCALLASHDRGQHFGRIVGSWDPRDKPGRLETILASEFAQSRKLSNAAIQGMTPQQRWAVYWALINGQALDVSNRLPNCKTVIYDDFCMSPEHAARELFAFAGLDWDQQTEAFLGECSQTNSAAYFSVLKNPEEAANRWRKELPEHIARAIADVIRDTPAGQCFDWTGL